MSSIAPASFPIPGQAHEQASAVADLLRGLFGQALVAVYLHGSAVGGGLRAQSDIDLLAILSRPMSEVARHDLARALVGLSGRHPAPPGGPRCVELFVFLEDEAADPAFPARAEFIYGEWLRDAFESGQPSPPVSDPENTLLLAQAAREALPLFGPPREKLLPDVPLHHIHAAMREALPTLLSSLKGDERNVLLTLARMWRTAVTGDFVSKDAAAAWAAPRMPAPEAQTLDRARLAYLGGAQDSREDEQVAQAARQTAAWLERRLLSLL